MCSSRQLYSFLYGTHPEDRMAASTLESWSHFQKAADHMVQEQQEEKEEYGLPAL